MKHDEVCEVSQRRHYWMGFLAGIAIGAAVVNAIWTFLRVMYG